MNLYWLFFKSPSSPYNNTQTTNQTTIERSLSITNQSVTTNNNVDSNECLGSTSMGSHSWQTMR